MPAEDDPARAFEDLRAEVSVLRRAVETLPGVLDAHRAPDYSLELGGLAKRLDGLTTQVEGLGRHPALQMTPQAHRAALGQAGEGVVREAVRQLEAATRSTEQSQREMARLIGGARAGAEQQRVLLWVAGLVFAGTFVLSPLLAGCLPFGLAERYAAWVVAGGDRWSAGRALMSSASPEGWRWIADASQLVRANAEGLSACREAASKAKKPQPCTVTVQPAP